MSFDLFFPLYPCKIFIIGKTEQEIWKTNVFGFQAADALTHAHTRAAEPTKRKPEPVKFDIRNGALIKGSTLPAAAAPLGTPPDTHA